MLTSIRRLPSPALVISAFALIVAIGGGTFAFASSDKQIHKISKATVKKISKKQANKEVNKLAPGLSVEHAGSADTATTATNATNATNADDAAHATAADSAATADSSQPTAFAHVSAAGVLDGPNSKNVGSVSKVGAVYCFSGISFTPRGGAATVDTQGSASESAQFGLGTNFGLCPAATQANVATIGGAAPFYVVFYR